VRALRLVIVGTGTGVGKTHVACALVAAWAGVTRVVGLKPIETGITEGRARRASEASDQERLTAAAQVFHVKRAPEHPGPARSGNAGSKRPFHVKHSSHPTRLQVGQAMRSPHSGPVLPQASLYTFPEPVSPHLAARDAGVRIDLGLIERWVAEHQAPVTIVETAGGLFSPLGHTSTNFELTRTLRPDGVLLVAPDRLGVLHDLTTTLALAAARGGLPVGIVLSAPAAPDASTGRNSHEIEALGIGAAITTFPRRPTGHSATVAAAHAVMAWAERLRPGSGPTD